LRAEFGIGKKVSVIPFGTHGFHHGYGFSGASRLGLLPTERFVLFFGQIALRVWNSLVDAWPG
jgi:hypothetical protein